MTLRFPVSLETAGATPELCAAFAIETDAARFAADLAGRSPTDCRVLVHDAGRPGKPVSATRGRVPHHQVARPIPSEPTPPPALPFGFHPNRPHNPPQTPARQPDLAPPASSHTAPIALSRAGTPATTSPAAARAITTAASSTPARAQPHDAAGSRSRNFAL